MTLNVEDKIARLAPHQRRKVEERAAALIAEEMTLRELRKARQLTQARVATELGYHPGRRLAPRATQRSATLHLTQNGCGNGRQAIAHCEIPRPAAGRAVRHRRQRPPRLMSSLCWVGR